MKDHGMEWDEYVRQELSALTPALARLGFSLEDEQPHLKGERYLQQAVTTAHGRKLVLLGHQTRDGVRVIIKAARDKNGSDEIEHERTCREALSKLNFAYQVFHRPEEVVYTHVNGFTVFVQKFLETARPFLERPLKEQFALALRAFKAQESAHATTYRHHRFIESTFGKKDARDYLQSFETFRTRIERALPDNTPLQKLLRKTYKVLSAGETTVEQYADFLTHTDFVPHNFRIVGGNIYLLDHSSIRFGNKHEGWARFINFMELYNPPLATLMVQYVRDNRAPEELRSLSLMRIYRLSEIICYYAETLEKASGNLLTLNTERVALWSAILTCVVGGTSVPDSLIESYKVKRDALRSPDEKKRQVGLH